MLGFVVPGGRRCDAGGRFESRTRPPPLREIGDARPFLQELDRRSGHDAHSRGPGGVRLTTGNRDAFADEHPQPKAGVRICDVSGDGRKAFIIWSDSYIAVYSNPAPSLRADIFLRRRDPIYMPLKSAGNVVYNAP